MLAVGACKAGEALARWLAGAPPRHQTPAPASKHAPSRARALCHSPTPAPPAPQQGGRCLTGGGCGAGGGADAGTALMTAAVYLALVPPPLPPCPP